MSKISAGCLPDSSWRYKMCDICPESRFGSELKEPGLFTAPASWPLYMVMQTMPPFLKGEERHPVSKKIVDAQNVSDSGQRRLCFRCYALVAAGEITQIEDGGGAPAGDIFPYILMRVMNKFNTTGKKETERNRYR